jgi:hypothetical protein
MSYSKDEKDWLGRNRTGHFDDQGNKIGTSKDEKDWLGRERTAHFDGAGNKTGVSKEEKDWLGNEKTVHYDEKGNKSGASKVEKDWLGKDVLQHYDKDGNKTGQSKYEKDWLGRRIINHKSSSSSGNTAIAYLILFAIIVIVVLGTFSYPYILVDPQISPFKLNWLNNKNVWIFCALMWTLAISLILILKIAIGDKNGEKINNVLVETGLIATLVFLAALSPVMSFIIKAKFETDFLLYSIIASIILLVIFGIAFWKTSKAIHTLSTFGLSAALSIFYLKGVPSLAAESYAQNENTIIDTPSQMNSSNQGNNSTSSYVVDEESAKQLTPNGKSAEKKEEVSVPREGYVIGNLEIMKSDLSGEMYLPDAQELASEKGGGWHIPSINELKILYENRFEIGGFKSDRQNYNTSYISSDEGDGDGTYREIKVLDFSDGSIGWDFYCCKGPGGMIRLVRTIQQ